MHRTRITNRGQSKKEAHVIIGANFGDEAKGLVTDALAHKLGSDAIVIRFNGGAQAGHTVTTPEGQRHVFGHFGSGTLVGCPTFLSCFFVCNPITFVREHAALASLGIVPVVFVDPNAAITSPYDMMLNQLIETMRGDNRHGSCGLGFGETIERQQYPAFCLTYADLGNQDSLLSRLKTIRDHWVPIRLRSLGIDPFSLKDPWAQYLTTDAIIESFLADVRRFLNKTLCAPDDLLLSRDKIIFEGAQGLLLDPAYGWFPYVSRSNTGMRNVIKLAKTAHIHKLDVHYLTRTYLTRHGAGPLPNELKEPPYSAIRDATNIPNQYQGALRFGLLDLDLLSRTIACDWRHVPASMDATCNLVVSCMDQIDLHAVGLCQGKVFHDNPDAFLKRALKTTGADSIAASWGPTRATFITDVIAGPRSSLWSKRA